MTGEARAAARPSGRAVLLRIGLLVGLVAFVFVVVLPQVVDLKAVGAALGGLTPGQLGILVAATVVAYVASASPARVLVRGLSWPHAVASDLVGRAVASTIPGPSDVAIKSILYRQWAVPVETASAGLVLASLFEPLSSLALPLIATVGVLATGGVASPRILTLTVAGLAVLVAVGFILVRIARSEALARGIGERLDRLATRVWTWVHRAPPTGIVDGVLEFRVRSGAILSASGFAGFGAAVAAKLAWFVVLELSLWATGIGWDSLPPSGVLAAMALVGIIALVPITPGAVGVSEVAYIGLLSAVAAPGSSEGITAAIVLFRVAQWLGPIPIGWLLLALIRGRHLSEMMADGSPGSPGSTAS